MVWKNFLLDWRCFSTCIRLVQIFVLTLVYTNLRIYFFIFSFRLFDVVGCIGFLANLFILPVLLSNKMQNTFNQLLIFLTVFDNIYVMCSIFECIRKYHLSTPLQIVSSKYISSMSWLKYFSGIMRLLLFTIGLKMSRGYYNRGGYY